MADELDDPEKLRAAGNKAFQGASLLNSGDYERAIATCMEAIEINPGSIGAVRTMDEAATRLREARLTIEEENLESRIDYILQRYTEFKERTAAIRLESQATAEARRADLPRRLPRIKQSQIPPEDPPIEGEQFEISARELWKEECDLCSAKCPNRKTLRAQRWNECSHCDQFYCPECIKNRLEKRRELLVFKIPICASCGHYVGRGTGSAGGSKFG